MSREPQVAAVAGLALVAVMMLAGKKPADPVTLPKTEIVKQQPKVSVPQPRPRPKPAVAKAKKKTTKAKPKKRGESFCERVKREYERMTWAERLAAYQRATPQQIAAGRRCLGM